jgi:hypothetical protein
MIAMGATDTMSLAPDVVSLLCDPLSHEPLRLDQLTGRGHELAATTVEFVPNADGEFVLPNEISRLNEGLG